MEPFGVVLPVNFIDTDYAIAINSTEIRKENSEIRKAKTRY